MRLRHLLLLASLASLPFSYACGSDDEKPANSCLPCLEGFDCRDGVCVKREEPKPEGCQSHNDCQFSPRGQLCERVSGRCVACLEDSHCHSARSCEVGVCTGTVCTDDSDCAAPTPACAVDGRSCVECRDDAACGEGRHCDAGACVKNACTSDEDCAESADTPRCDGGTGACVACLGDLDCADDELCAGGACEPRPGCRIDADCGGHPEGDRCEAETGACVPCVTDLHCGLGEACVDHACEPATCEVLEDCPAGSICDDGGCAALGACGSDADCAADPRVPRCGAAGACVQCASEADCAGGGQCVNGACTAPAGCTSDAQCKGGFVCTAGGCAACRTDEQCPRGACRAGVCSDRATCASDADCATGRCVAGVCAPCGSDLDCRPGLWCEEGACVEAAACTSNEDCGPGRLCDGALCQPSGCADDGLEPDGGPSSAKPVGLGAPASRVLCPNDEDWLAFSAVSRSALEVSLLSAPADVTFSLVWFEPGDERVRQEQPAIGHRLIVPSLPSAAAGRYFLRVRGKGGAQGAYTIMPRIGTGACSDPFEPNNVRTQASTVQPGVLYEGLTICDTDFYVFDLPPDHAASVYALYPDGDAQLALFTDTGNALPGSRFSDTPFLGGGKVGEWSGSTSGARILARVTPGTRPPSSYRLFVAATPLLACGAEPVALDLGADRGRVTGATLGHAAGTVPGMCGGGGPETTWAVRLDDAGRLVARIAAPFSAVLSLRDAACTAEQSCMAAAGGVGALDVPRLDAGDYVLAVGGRAGQAGPFDLALRRLDPIDPPANDLCADPIDLVLGPATVTVSGITEGATASPAGSGMCEPLAPDVFYAFSLAQDARVVVEATADQPISVSFADPACQGDGSCAAPGKKQRLDRTLPAGTHLLRVASATGAAAGFTLKVTAPDPLPNDACAAAAALTVPGNVTGDTTWATNAVSFPLATSCTGYFVDGGELFYAVTLTQGQMVVADLTPSPRFDPALYVLGGCGAPPQCLAGIDAPGAGVAERLLFTAPSAGTYYLVVDGAAGGGSFTLSVQ